MAGCLGIEHGACWSAQATVVVYARIFVGNVNSIPPATVSDLSFRDWAEEPEVWIFPRMVDHERYYYLFWI